MEKTVLPEDEQLFVDYLELWHGDHSSRNCEIKRELKKYDIGTSSLDKLADVFDKVDGAWDSWAMRLQEIKNKQQRAI